MNLKRRLAELFPGLAYGYSALRLKSKSPSAVFGEILERKAWGSRESVSGPGSELAQTRVVVRELPPLLRRFGIRSMLDIPCGDFHWMRHVDLEGIRYVGADLVPELVQANRTAHGPGENRTFEVLDLLRDPLPEVDLVLCRDCLVHFSFQDARSALRNIRRSGSRFLLTTTFPSRDRNRDIATGQWYPIQLRKAPFHLPDPLELIVEECTENNGKYSDKSLGLWRISDIESLLE